VTGNVAAIGTRITKGRRAIPPNQQGMENVFFMLDALLGQ
jgi:hypothetical protein